MYNSTKAVWQPPKEVIWTPEEALDEGKIGVYFIVDGNNAAGKSSFFNYLRTDYSRKLSRNLKAGEQLKFLEEPVKARASEIEAWYKSLGEFGNTLKKSDIGFEYAALQWRTEQLMKELKGFRGIAIGERHAEVGPGYYVETLYKQGKITRREYHEYMALFTELVPYLAWPQGWGTLHTTAKVCDQRVQNDPERKQFEKNYNTLPYLSGLEAEILENLTVRVSQFCEDAGRDEPVILMYNTTPSLEVDPELRHRAAQDFIAHIELIVDQQREEIEKRKNAKTIPTENKKRTKVKK